MKSYTYLLLILGLTVFASCEREDVFQMPAPTIMPLFDGPSEIVQEPGNEVYLEFNLQASSGLSSFTIFKDDLLMEELFFDDEISHEFVFRYTVPWEETVGTENDFKLEVTDKEGRADVYDIHLLIRSTFSETHETINGTEVITVKGKLNQDYTFHAENTYVIDSVLSVENNARLTVEAGSTVYFRTYGDQNTFSQLAINRGSRIIAEGTADQPIVFTSDKVLLGQTPSPTDWGGVFILGAAPTNEGPETTNSGYRYGGNLPNDNSGILKYVRVEYAGKADFHAIHFFSVGAGTRVENLQVFQNENIAIRVRGGRVNFKYLSAIGHGGYGIWCDSGWQGNGQFWLFQTHRQATLVPVNFWNIGRSIEMRNNDNFFLTTPRTTFKISNVTLIGNGFEPGVPNGTRRGVRIRTGSTGILQNMIVTQFPDDGVRVEDLDIAELGESMILDNTYSFNNIRNYEQEALSFFYENPDYNLSTEAVGGINLNNFVGSHPTGFNPASMGSFFTAAPYAGAVENAENDWTSIGSWFKNIDGTIR